MTESRPWGEYTVIASGDSFKVKLITVNPKSRLSLQKHKHRAEYWYIVDGKGTVTLNGNRTFVVAGDHIYVPVGAVHRVEAHAERLRFVEVQTGTYFGEDDIERLEDDYGRNSV